MGKLSNLWKVINRTINYICPSLLSNHIVIRKRIVNILEVIVYIIYLNGAYADHLCLSSTCQNLLKMSTISAI